ncbi:sensor histidine kinase [Salinibacterium hongtaonis]|uniref:sensor histidine kinase n=1 Tax=Homoserinimonas hongtaonis TaxID=2079791 RepID=UPI000D385E5C|nr:sensor histidine kinase [Salinibacterium hongtaonis]AWB90274.1 two-component sensor histidine kinase [Salinibacterium hongtaonis]
MTDEWKRPRPDAAGYRRDALGAIGLTIGAGLSSLLYYRIGSYDDPAPVWLTAVVIAAMTLPLALRRRYPELVAVIASVGFFVTQQFAVPEFLVSNITLFMAIYSVGAWSTRRRRATIVRLAIIAGMFIWITVNLIISVSDPELLPNVSRSGVFSQFASFALLNFATNLLYFGGAYYFGDRMWAAARQRAVLEERTAELADEREHSMRQAIALDRVRIARELHDVVAHHVSVMGVQAGAARRVLATDAAQATESLVMIESSARSAVDEMHRLLATLRDPLSADEPNEGAPDAAAQASSTRGLEQVPELVAQSTAAGVSAKLVTVGQPHPATPLVGFTLYRVCQEALTNVRKHAGDRATAEVRIRYLGDSIELEVTDTGIGRGLSRGTTGHGHIGMRERLAAVGGRLEVGPRPRGGYLVRAIVPLTPAGGSWPDDADSDASLTEATP